MGLREWVVTAWLWAVPAWPWVGTAGAVVMLAWAAVLQMRADTALVGLLFLALGQALVAWRDRRLRVIIEHVPLVASPSSPTPAGLHLDTGPAFALVWSALPAVLHLSTLILWIESWASTGAPWAVVLVTSTAAFHALGMDVLRVLVVRWALETQLLEAALRERVFDGGDVEFGSIQRGDAAETRTMWSPYRHFRWTVVSLGGAPMHTEDGDRLVY